MRTFIACLVFVVLAAKGQSECPKEKTVGDICYQLVENEKGFNTSLYGCKDGCVYTTRSGKDTFCFKDGGFPVMDTCSAKNQTQENMNERLNLLETTSEALLDMAKRSVYQPRPKEQIMDCQNECMINETIETFAEYRECSKLCLNLTIAYVPQTNRCKEAGAPLKGRCVSKWNPTPPKIKAIKTLEGPSGDPLCKGTAECAIYRWKCDNATKNTACQQKMKENPYYNGDPRVFAYFAACFPGKSDTFYYLPLHREFLNGTCNPVGTGQTGCGCIGGPSCTCDCTCLVFYRQYLS